MPEEKSRRWSLTNSDDLVRFAVTSWRNETKVDAGALATEFGSRNSLKRPHWNLIVQTLSVHFLPALMHAESLRGSTAVIIDILRASTTIITALQNGASRVIPCGSPDEARRIRNESLSDIVLLGGERGGVLIDGFDCGNSPTEYPPSRVAGNTIAFTTTNGTKALRMSAAAETILIGAFVNRQALVDRLLDDHRSIHLVCAGTDGEITGEDVLFAGTVAEMLTCGTHKDRWELNDAARIAQTFWRQSASGESATKGNNSLSAQIESAMRQTRGGRNLMNLGYDNDIRLCAAADSIRIVPMLQQDGSLRRSAEKDLPSRLT